MEGISKICGGEFIMYSLKITFEISAAHLLNLSYRSPCTNIHGHNYIITMFFGASELNPDGMIIDMSKVKNEVKKIFDHQYLNDVLSQPTAENMACFLCKKYPQCFKVIVQETQGGEASYEKI